MTFEGMSPVHHQKRRNDSKNERETYRMNFVSVMSSCFLLVLFSRIARNREGVCNESIHSFSSCYLRQRTRNSRHISSVFAREQFNLYILLETSSCNFYLCTLI